LELHEVPAKERLHLALTHDGTVIEVDAPKPLSSSSHFTIFWQGITFHEDIGKFVLSSLKRESQLVGTLLFFPSARFRFPARLVEDVPSELELSATRQYGKQAGSPSFVRYEVYPQGSPGQDLTESLYAIWANIAAPDQFQPGLAVRASECIIQPDRGIHQS
jgi:hypothetical protein